MVTKPQKYREMTKKLARLGCTSAEGKGDHEKWFCPCGEHMAVITQTRKISPGVVRNVEKALECLPEGWNR